MAGAFRDFENGISGIGLVAVLIGIVLVALWLRDNFSGGNRDNPLEQARDSAGAEVRNATDKFAIADAVGFDGYDSADLTDNQTLASLFDLIPDSVRANPGQALADAGLF